MMTAVQLCGHLHIVHPKKVRYVATVIENFTFNLQWIFAKDIV